MSTLRLTFLYPHLFRSIRASEPRVYTVRQCCRRSASDKASFATSSRRGQRFVERHGKAVEPFLASGETKEDTKVFVPESKPETVKKNSAKNSNKKHMSDDLSQHKSPNPGESETSSTAPLSEEMQAVARIPGDSDVNGQESSIVNEESDQMATDTLQAQISPTEDGALEEVLEAELPVVDTSDELHVPHLHPPQYVHNFDTWTLVKEVEKGGFTAEQAITAMKAVRVLLAKNLEFAKEGLVSKSDVENETYLFRAACSELRTEIQNTRRASDEKMRRERTLLQNEVDILNQRLTQELLSLKDELTGMFNDRKMAVRMEQREMDSAIQSLSYQITVALNSDSKSEVEGLRWILTRRSVLAIVFMALMVLSSLRYASYRAHEDEMERKRQEKYREADAAQRARHSDGEGMADEGTQTDGDDPPERRDLPAGTAAESLSAC